MASLAVSAKGQVTFKRDVLQHLGIESGERIELEKLPGGEVRIRAVRPAGSIEQFFHALGESSPQRKPLSIERMNSIAKAGWSGRLKSR